MKNTFIICLLFCFHLAVGQTVNIERACGFNKVFSNSWSQTLTGIKSPVNDSIVSGLISQLNKDKLRLVVAATADHSVQYALTGLIKRPKANGVIDTFFCIVINENNLNQLSAFARVTILAHEIGHINNGNFLSSTEIDSTCELGADYYAGKSCARIGFDSLSQVSDVYLDLDSDDVHPEPKRRILEVSNGWADGKQPSRFLFFLKSLSQIDNPPFPYSQVFDDELTLREIITPSMNGKFLVRIFLAPKNEKIPATDILDRVKYINYYIHHPSFTQTPANNYDRKTDFSILLTKVWGDDFDVFADITFQDGTVKKNVSLTVKFL